MTALRWAGVAFLVAGAAAAPLNVLHAQWFSGAEIVRVPLLRVPEVRSGAVNAAQAYPALIMSLKPEQSPVAIYLEAELVAKADDGHAANRYVTHLISGSAIAAKADAVLAATGNDAAPHTRTLALLRTKINTAGLYTVLVSESAAPAFALSKATLTVRANTRRADVVNVLAGIAFMLIGAVTLFATGKRRAGNAAR